MAVEDGVHHQHVVAFFLGFGDVGVLLLLVGGVEVYQHFVLVFLQRLDAGFVFVEGEIFVVDVLEEREFLGTFVEFLVAEHAVFDENLDVVPFLFKVLAVGLEQFLQLVGHLFADVRRYFLHVAVALQVRAANVEGYVGRVEHAVQQHKIFGHNTFHRVGNEYLIAVQLYAVLLGVHSAFHLGEIEYSGEVEGIVHVQMYLEQRIFEIHRV